MLVSCKTMSGQHLENICTS